MAAYTPRVALFGGTFDPIHVGHLAVARAALGSGLVDSVRFVPAGNPPHKPDGPRHAADDRWCMAVLATLDEPRFRVERWEIDRPGRSYAIDTVRQARAELALPEGGLYWVIGADAMALIHTWHQAEALLRETRFLVIGRDDLDGPALRARLAASGGPMPTMTYLEMPRVDVSSTDLRRRLAAGVPRPEGLSPGVATYIERYGLYRAAERVNL
jgi:nicotinate-nucleotide adenylyltransferase